ncbi:MAG: TetR/AcrR family transcriptional regulator [Bacteroidota bacterium]
MNTKQKILNASIRLFNENGMANVRLQQIAKDIGISVGNLAYHYENKKAIVKAINEDLHGEISEILSTYRIFPNLMDLDVQLTKYFNFAQKYPFYFLDLLEIERQYSDIHAKRQQYISKMVSQIRKRFDFNEQRGIIQKEERRGVYDSVANSIWVLITFWMPQEQVKGANGNIQINQFKEAVWNQIYPYFTDAGIKEYEQLIVPILQQSSSDN